MDFPVHRVGIQPCAALADIGFGHAVQVGEGIVQAENFRCEAVRTGGFKKEPAGFGFLVGIGVDDEHGALRILPAACEGCRLFFHVAAVGLGEGGKVKPVSAGRVGERKVVVYVDDFGIGIDAQELGDFGLGEHGFARAFVSAQEDEFLHKAVLGLIFWGGGCGRVGSKCPSYHVNNFFIKQR